MKKIILICAILLTSVIVHADDTMTCADGAGTVITGKNGTEYCMSKNKMNWWTALGWCQKIGKKLISYPEECKCPTDICGETMSGCPNLTGVYSAHMCVWTIHPNFSDQAKTVCLNNGTIGGAYRNTTGINHGIALCK